MRRRCNDPAFIGYAQYGGKGIQVCERWGVFVHFMADMGPRPAGYSLDRIDGRGNYEPGNCRWATRATQNQNRKSVYLVGPLLAKAKRLRPFMTLKQLTKYLGLAPGKWSALAKAVEDAP